MTMTDNGFAPATTDVSPEIVPADLVAALNAVIPHASSDSTLPIIAVVRFESRDGALTLVATDRYTLGTYTIPWKGEEFDVSLPLAAAKDLLRFVKGMTKGLPLQLTVADGYLTADQFGTRTTLQLQDGDFVKWRAIMPDREALRAETGRVAEIGFNPAYLAKFAKAADKYAPMRLILGASPLKPARIEIGESFVGLIMPVRLDS